MVRVFDSYTKRSGVGKLPYSAVSLLESLSKRPNLLINDMHLKELRAKKYVFIFPTTPYRPPVPSVGEPVNQSVSLAMTGLGGRLFLSGGFNGVTLGRLLTLTVPADPCSLLSTPESCNVTTGSCVWCSGACTSSDAAERYLV